MWTQKNMHKNLVRNYLLMKRNNFAVNRYLNFLKDEHEAIWDSLVPAEGINRQVRYSWKSCCLLNGRWYQAKYSTVCCFNLTMLKSCYFLKKGHTCILFWVLCDHFLLTTVSDTKWWSNDESTVSRLIMML